MTKRALVYAIAAAAAAAPLRAQVPDKQFMLRGWEDSRANVVGFIDAVPDSALGYAPTKGVRSFAQQIDHIVSTNLEVAARALRAAKEPPALGDTAKYLHDKAALRAYANATYDYVIAAVRDARPAELARPAALFGLPAQPRWAWAELSREHSAWTLGQLVPYLRLNGVSPPPYKAPF